MIIILCCVDISAAAGEKSVGVPGVGMMQEIPCLMTPLVMCKKKTKFAI